MTATVSSVPYVEVRGELAPGWSVVVRWQDGDWSGDEFALEKIRQAIMLDFPEGRIGQSPTGPYFPVDSPIGARLLAVLPFKRIASIESDFVMPELESVPGRVYGPPIMEGWQADSGLETRWRERMRGIKVKPLTVERDKPGAGH